MSYLSRLQNILNRHGPKAAVAKFWGIAADRWFDWRHGTDNRTPEKLDGYTIVGESRKHAASYGASRAMPLKCLFTRLRGRSFGGGGFVDFGCGNAKVLVMAAHCQIRPVRGVEFARELCELARRNWAAFCHRTGTPAETGTIIEGDAGAYACQPDETMYFLYCPSFDETILRKVLANISASLRAHPRAAAIIICNASPSYQAVMQEMVPEFAHLQKAIFWGYPYFIYSNRTD